MGHSLRDENRFSKNMEQYSQYLLSSFHMAKIVVRFITVTIMVANIY